MTATSDAQCIKQEDKMALLKRVKYTPAQLQSRLNTVCKKAGFKFKPVTKEQWATINTSSLGYRYAPVLKNTGPYKKFVLYYLNAITSDGTPSAVKDEAYKVMGHAVTEMRRAFQHQGKK